MDSPRIKNGLRLFQVLGIAGYVNGMLDSDAHAMELDDIMREAAIIRNMSPGSQDRMIATSLWLLVPVRTYLNRLLPEDDVANIATGISVRKVMADFVDQLEGNDPCALEPR